MYAVTRSVFLAILMSVACLSWQQTLDNEAILKMTKAALSEEIIVGTVNSQPGKYVVGPDELIALKQAGVTDKVLAAMVSKGSQSPTLSSPTPAKANGELKSDVAGGGLVSEIGVYMKRGDKWEEVVPEPINWKTGGALKSVASVGVVKKDMNGNLAGTHSRNVIKSPIEFLIFTREGESYGEYQLLRLRENKDYREFRFVTGGVFNQKGGAQRDLLTYEATKIAPRTYRIILPDNLGYGEYGFLPPNLLTTTSASAQLGKMFTFRIPN